VHYKCKCKSFTFVCLSCYPHVLLSILWVLHLTFAWHLCIYLWNTLMQSCVYHHVRPFAHVNYGVIPSFIQTIIKSNDIKKCNTFILLHLPQFLVYDKTLLSKHNPLGSKGWNRQITLNFQLQKTIYTCFVGIGGTLCLLSRCKQLSLFTWAIFLDLRCYQFTIKFIVEYFTWENEQINTIHITLYICLLHFLFSS
jgi:hypothetical protein